MKDEGAQLIIFLVQAHESKLTENALPPQSSSKTAHQHQKRVVFENSQTIARCAEHREGEIALLSGMYMNARKPATVCKEKKDLTQRSNTLVANIHGKTITHNTTMIVEENPTHL